jgi:hypothetical protein
MNTLLTTVYGRARAYSWVLLGVLISGCANSTTPTSNSPVATPVALGDVYDCSDPAAAGAKMASICVVFDVAGCPVYTVYGGKLNALPELERAPGPNGVNKLRWQAVQLQSKGTYQAIAADYRIFFDPFQGAPIKTTGNKGAATSQPLGCGGGCELPGGVEFKYTVQAESKPGCDPLDPMFRVNQ